MKTLLSQLKPEFTFAGLSMGVGMASSLNLNIYPDEESAAYAADSMAEIVAEEEREYQEEQAEESEQ